MVKSFYGHERQNNIAIASQCEGITAPMTSSSLFFLHDQWLSLTDLVSGVVTLCTTLNGQSRLTRKPQKPLKRSHYRIALPDAEDETNCKVPLWEDRKQ